ncbi:GYDIA family GHMP kinase [Ascidiimonas aurantiaca]|uniref:GYDIA family GHMP kinase n=1 Tax=Ascidiimonas aurantiaca TaxID=1685432 RepID=UPI0030EF79BF
MLKKFYSNGKLLLTGEYAVLDGALSLAFPVRFGQFLEVKEQKKNCISWQSLDHENKTWYTVQLPVDISKENRDGETAADKQPETRTLKNVLRAARNLNPRFLSGTNGYQVTTRLTFPRNWGLGSSSTLINNIALWAEVDPYRLLWESFPGSGYDIACANHTYPLTYQIKNGKPSVKEVAFSPSFRDKLFFVHLNKKQNSREGILQYRKTGADKKELARKITSITNSILQCSTLNDFEVLLQEHENLISSALGLPTIKKQLFDGYTGGTIKSLGAWGGDFILVTGENTSQKYFTDRDYTTIIPFKDMLL